MGRIALLETDHMLTLNSASFDAQMTYINSCVAPGKQELHICDTLKVRFGSVQVSLAVSMSVQVFFIKLRG